MVDNARHCAIAYVRVQVLRWSTRCATMRRCDGRCLTCAGKTKADTNDDKVECNALDQDISKLIEK